MSSGGGGGAPADTTTTSELPSWAQPAAQQILTQGQSLASQPAPTYTGNTVAGLNSTEQNAINQSAQASNQAQTNAGAAGSQVSSMQANPNGYQTGNAYTGNVSASNVADPYTSISNNTQLTAAENAADQPLTQNYSQVTAPTTLAQFRNGGAFGGSAQTQATANNEYQLGNALGNTNAAITNNAYNTAATAATNEAAQQNQVNETNQSVGTQAGESENTLNQNAYNTQQTSTVNAINAATGANTAASSNAANALQAGNASQQNEQDVLNSLYQQWYNQANAPYQSLSTLSSALSGALGSGVGTTVSQQQAGTGNSLGTLLGLGSTALGAYNAAQY